MKKFSILLSIVAVLTLLIAAKPKPIKIFMAGDSTMADKPIEENPERGWGMVLPSYFNDNVIVENHARNGRSTRSFIKEGRWDTLMNRVGAGDYVIIEFGHNDEKVDTDRGTTLYDFKANFKKFVADVRAKGATPIICTPIERRKFDANGKFVDQHGLYPDKIRQIAKEENVAFIDLQVSTRTLIESKGPEESKKLFLHIAPGVYKLAPKGSEDDTHMSVDGAMEVAKMAIEGFKTLGLKSLTDNLRAEKDVKVTFTQPFNELK
ncbi:MAG: rhamnogalacturonan acetylesterase [Hungatella sp.]|nr:rhamnogalacturonan acetylesterase [Hungatella sp.]MTK06592.1 rhamnogalacturonan acetylesterase [Hungatella sp.]